MELRSIFKLVCTDWQLNGIPYEYHHALGPVAVTRLSKLQWDPDITELLIRKNKAYGNSALDPVRRFSLPTTTPEEMIRVRIDDKLSRLERGGADDGEDTWGDLGGYLVLLHVAKRYHFVEGHGWTAR